MKDLNSNINPYIWCQNLHVWLLFFLQS